MDWLSFFWGFEVTVVLGGLGALLFGVIGDGLLMTPKQRGAGQTGNTSWVTGLTGSPHTSAGATPTGVAGAPVRSHRPRAPAA